MGLKATPLPVQNESIDRFKLKSALKICLALKCPLNRWITELFRRYPDGHTFTVAEIEELSGHPQSQVSGALTQLRRVGILDYDRRGKHHDYRFVRPRYDQIATAVQDFARPKAFRPPGVI